MKQQSFPIPSSSKEHGGQLPSARRRRRRPLSPKRAHHLVLRSDFASGPRNLMKHHRLIHHVLKKSSLRFSVKVYQRAIVRNHLHLLVKGKSRIGLQNFFRVVAGHIAQEILRSHPIRGVRGAPGAINATKISGGRRASDAPGNSSQERKLLGAKAYARENKFWEARIYTRIVEWGRDFRSVTSYVIRNIMEALGIIPYQTRNTS